MSCSQCLGPPCEDCYPSGGLLTPDEYKAAARTLAATLVSLISGDKLRYHMASLDLARRVMAEAPREIVDQAVAESQARREVGT